MTTAATGGFEKLLGELDILAKALPSEEGATDPDTADADAAADAGDPAAAAGEDKDTLAKSFKIKLEDGTEIEAEDGTELGKALTDRLDKSEVSMLKALGTSVALLKSQAKAIADQGELIKSLQDQVSKLGGEGRGRKTTVTVLAKSSSAAGKKDEPEGVTPQEFLVKAMSAHSAGKISGHELSLAEGYINRGTQVPEQIVSKVLS